MILKALTNKENRELYIKLVETKKKPNKKPRKNFNNLTGFVTLNFYYWVHDCQAFWLLTSNR